MAATKIDEIQREIKRKAGNISETAKRPSSQKGKTSIGGIFSGINSIVMGISADGKLASNKIVLEQSKGNIQSFGRKLAGRRLVLEKQIKDERERLEEMKINQIQAADTLMKFEILDEIFQSEQRKSQYSLGRRAKTMYSAREMGQKKVADRRKKIEGIKKELEKKAKEKGLTVQWDNIL